MLSVEKEIKLSKTKFKIARCNICYASNIKSNTETMLGEYKPILYDLQIGQQVMCLCPDCIKKLIGVLQEFEQEGNAWLIMKN